MIKNKKLLLIKNRRRTAYYFTFGGIIAVFAVMGFIFATSQQSHATIPAGGKQNEIGQVSYRFYSPSNSANPGAPLAGTNTQAILSKPGADFRLRVVVQNKGLFTKSLAAVGEGHNHGCAILSDNKAYCWGEGAWGALGTNSTSDSSTPTPIYTDGDLSGKTIKQIATGDWHSCAIVSDNRVYCWGYGSNGELGNGTYNQANAPVAVSTSGVMSGKNITQIATGFNHNCALDSDGKIYCWGQNAYGELGNNSTTISNVPVATSMNEFGGRRVKQIIAGFFYSCALTTDGSVFCWGTTENGRIGAGQTSGYSARPVQISFGGKKVESISGHATHACAVISGSQGLYCWGKNNRGQIGNGSTTDSYAPSPASVSGILGGGKTIRQVKANYEHTCVLISSGDVYCWGAGDKGQLGNGSTSDSTSPVKVNMLSITADNTISDIASGSNYSCALTTRGYVYCWGENSHYQLGNGSSSNALTPTSLSTPGRTIGDSAIKLRAEYAKKGSAVTCSAVNGAAWRAINGAAKLRYATNGPADGTAITKISDDPALPDNTVGTRPQTIVRKNSPWTTFVNTQDIAAGEVGVWDLVLADRGLDRNENYCVRLVTDTTAAPGTSVDTYDVYPEFKTAPGSLDLRFANSAGTTVVNPTARFADATTSRNSVITGASLSDSNSKQIEVVNTQTDAGWSVVLSASNGSTARWQQSGGTKSYMFNGNSDTQGFLSVKFAAASVITSGNSLSGSSCNTSGVQKGSDLQFQAGGANANSITLMSSSSSTGQLGCAFLLRNVRLNQTIPAYQSPGVYNLPMTLTVTAQ